MITTMRLVIHAILISLQTYRDYNSRVFASTITVPEMGFQKTFLEFIQVTTKLEWNKAADVCSTEHEGSLVKVNDLSERDALLEFVVEHSVANHFWIGLQWSNGEKLWNDGSCTPVNTTWFHYKDSSHSAFNSANQCFAAHDETVLEWEAFKCTDKKHFVCEKRSETITTSDVNAEFYVLLQPESNKEICASLCKTLDQCFISSPIESACIVGLASNQANTNVITIGSQAGQTVTSASSSASMGETPPLCVDSGGSVVQQEVTTLTNYTIINGNWQDPNIVNVTASAECPPTPSPLVSSVYVTEHVTVTSVQVSVTTSPVEIHTCTALPDVTEIIQPTAVVHIMTSVVTETTTVPSFVTVTSQIIASTCGESSAIYTTTVNSCDTVTTTDALIAATSTQRSGGTSDPSAIFSEISERFRAEVETLILDKDDLSKTIRSKNTADNKLFSSVALGFSFSLVCVFFIAVIILSDMAAILNHLKTLMWVNIRSLSRSY